MRTRIYLTVSEGLADTLRRMAHQNRTFASVYLTNVVTDALGLPRDVRPPIGRRRVARKKSLPPEAISMLRQGRRVDDVMKAMKGRRLKRSRLNAVVEGFAQ